MAFKLNNKGWFQDGVALVYDLIKYRRSRPGYSLTMMYRCIR